MASRSNPVSSRISRSAPSGDPLADLERARHALPEARQDLPRRAPEQQDLDARRPLAIDPAVDEVGADGAHRRSASPWSCSRCIRSWTPAKTSHSPQRSRPTGGCTSGHGSASWPATARAARSTIRWLWAILRRSVGRGPRPPHRGSPWTTGGASAGHRPVAASCAARHSPARDVRVVADGLGDVPVRLAARLRERRVRERLDERCQRRGQRRRVAPRRPPPCPGPPRRRTSRRTSRNRPSSMPRHAPTMSGAPGSRTSTQPLIGGRSP